MKNAALVSGWTGRALGSGGSAARALRRPAAAVGMLAALAAAAPAWAQAPERQPNALLVTELPAPQVLGWTDLVRQAVHDAWAPLSAGFEGIRHAAERIGAAGPPEARSPSVRMEFEPVRLEAPANQPLLGPVWSGSTPWRPELTADSDGSGFILNPRRFNVPWLVAPDNEFHQMPMVSVARIGTARVDFVGATIGGRTGTVIASVVYHF